MSVSILIGDVRDRLREMPADSIDCVVTSPPYWGLRDYGVAGQIGLEPTLGEHLAVMVDVFEEVRRVLKPTGTLWLNYGDCYATSPNGRSAADTKAAGNDDRTFRDKPFSTIQGALKAKDLAMVPNKLAIELQKPRYMGRIKDVADRVWLACLIDGEGSIFGSTQPAGYPTGRDRKYVRTQAHFDTGVTISNTCRALLERCVEITGYGKVNEAKRGPTNRRTAYVWRIQGSKAREVLSEVYPHLVAKQHEARLAIGSPPSGDVAEKCHAGLKSLHQGIDPGFDLAAPPSLFQPGWWVRSEIIWAKPNPMPESINDRPATSHEKIFLLSKAPRYHYDAAAVRQEAVGQNDHDLTGGRYAPPGQTAHTGSRKTKTSDKQGALPAPAARARRVAGFNDRWDASENAGTIKTGRNLRNYEPAPVQVWPIATRPFSEAHFATFPPELAERCILAGAPSKCCSNCGAAVVRTTSTELVPTAKAARRNVVDARDGSADRQDAGSNRAKDGHIPGWSNRVTTTGFSKSCGCDDPSTVPGKVLDPFGGAGTTALVGDRMGLDCTIIELNPEYAEIARNRIASEQGMFANVKVAA